MGEACDEYAATVDEHRAVIEGIVADMAVEAGLTLTAGAVIGFFTVGSGAAAGAAISGWRIASAAKRILTALHALKPLAKATAVARLTSAVEKVRPLRKVLERLKSAKRLRKGGQAGEARREGAASHTAAKAGRPSSIRPTRPPTAGADWEGRVIGNGKGEMWQRPGAIRNADSIRIMEPTADYPYGYVSFTNCENHPIGVDGKSGSKAHTPTSR